MNKGSRARKIDKRPSVTEESKSEEEFQIEDDRDSLVDTPLPCITIDEVNSVLSSCSATLEYRMNKRSKVRVFVRTKPTDNFAHDMIELRNDEKAVVIHGKRDSSQGVVNNQIMDWSFKLDGILHNASQEQVYDTIGNEMITNLLSGYNGTLLCYGQTGAGKTFTMTGATENFKHRGLIPRALAQVYREIEERQENAVTVRISYLEIYNEMMFDLLSTLPDAIQYAPQMTITEDEFGINIKGLTHHLAHNEEEALNLLFEGETNRAIAAHSLNQASSRSHCIFTIHIESRSRTDSSAKYMKSKLNLVDLAGSERLSKTGSAGKTQQEAMYINKSLSFLEQTIIALTDKRREHVPYRQTKLTHALKDSIGGNCNTIMVANVWAERAQTEETVSTLRFATRMMCVANEPAINEFYDPVLLVKKLEKEIKHLKHELAMHDTLANRGQVTYEPLSDSQQHEIQNQVRLYLEGSLEEIDVINIRQIQSVFSAFKNLVNQMESEVEGRLTVKYTLIDKTDPNSIAAAQKAGVVFDEEGNATYVGEPDNQNFGIGIAPSPTKPTHSAVVSATKRARSKKVKERASPMLGKGVSPVPSTQQTERSTPPRVAVDTRDSNTRVESVSGNDSLRPGSETAPQPRPNTPPPRTVAFEDFKQEKGVEINRILVENKDILGNKKKECRELAKMINLTKQEIDSTRMAIEKLKTDRMEQGEFTHENGEMVISEDEFQLIKKLKELKASYRSDYEELRNIKSEVQYCQKLVDQCRQRLISEFDNWYTSSFLTNGDAITTSNQAGFGIRPGTMYNNVPEDEGEKFDRLQRELLLENPDSAPYYNARMRTVRRHTLEEAMNQTQPKQQRSKPLGTPTRTVRNTPPNRITMVQH